MKELREEKAKKQKGEGGGKLNALKSDRLEEKTEEKMAKFPDRNKMSGVYRYGRGGAGQGYLWYI